MREQEIEGKMKAMEMRKEEQEKSTVLRRWPTLCQINSDWPDHIQSSTMDKQHT